MIKYYTISQGMTLYYAISYHTNPTFSSYSYGPGLGVWASGPRVCGGLDLSRLDQACRLASLSSEAKTLWSYSHPGVDRGYVIIYVYTYNCMCLYLISIYIYHIMCIHMYIDVYSHAAPDRI